MPKVKSSKSRAGSKSKKAATPPPSSRTQASSVLFGLVMVVAIIVAGAAMLGGSLSKAEKRWVNAFDSFARTTGFAVQRVEVIGLEHMPELARNVRDSAMIAPGENMFRADPYLIRRRVSSTQLVANVRVYRLWPDTVMIRADAAKPTAAWHDGDAWKVVDSFGRVMPGQNAVDHGGLLRITGDAAADAMPLLNRTLFFHPDLRTDIDYARRIAERRWDIVLKDGTRISLPDDRQLAHGLARLGQMRASQNVIFEKLDRVDLRVVDRTTVTPKQKKQREAA